MLYSYITIYSYITGSSDICVMDILRIGNLTIFWKLRSKHGLLINK